jgi:hypothetical protein
MTVFQEKLPHYPWMEPSLARLPGVQPLTAGDYLRRDEAFAGQMALRDGLIEDKRGAVHGLLPQARAAAEELYDLVLDKISQDTGYRLGATTVLRPDGVEVDLDRSKPLLTLGRLVQEDLCILQTEGDEHHLTGAILCFPASWTLVQKLGRAMMSIHSPVDSYTPEMAARVQRMFDAIRVEQGLWRMNFLTYETEELHHPRPEEAPRDRSKTIAKPFVRCERQCLIRLPNTRAVVFTIHTYVMPMAALPPDARESLEKISH